MWPWIDPIRAILKSWTILQKSDDVGDSSLGSFRGLGGVKISKFGTQVGTSYIKL